MVEDKVLPGEFLCTEEECMPGAGAFSEDGSVYSDAAGSVAMNTRLHTVNVVPSKKLRTIQKGSVIFGRVMMVKENFVNVEILQGPLKEDRTVIFMTRAMLPIRNVSTRYVERLRDEFRVGDLIKAKVVKSSHLGIDLATDDFSFGVIKAFCTKCRHPLHLFGQSLRCLNCGNSENRKVSSDYLVR
ncbi:MAG: exosome complex RNA-binding protein Csl4 [Candidatus Diapherotrites archaeon]|nr:exosome complex RNA-binding protein Csl4 [Candidatus Diapherotrites archaeon]